MRTALRDFSIFDCRIDGAVLALAAAVPGLSTNAVLRDTYAGILAKGLVVFRGVAAGVVARAVTVGFQ
jgi:hypothetical protein